MDSSLRVIERMVTDFFTNPEMIKCVHSDEGSLFLTDATSVLHELDLKDPLAEYIVSATYKYGKQQGFFSADTGLYFVCMFVRICKKLQQQGIPVDVTTSEIQHIFQDVQANARMKTVSVQEAVSALHEFNTRALLEDKDKAFESVSEVGKIVEANVEYGLTRNPDNFKSIFFVPVVQASEDCKWNKVEIVTSPSCKLEARAEESNVTAQSNEGESSNYDTCCTDEFEDGNEDDLIKELEQLQTDIANDLETVKIFQTLSQSRQPYENVLMTHDDDSDFEDCFEHVNSLSDVIDVSKLSSLAETEVKYAGIDTEESDEWIEVNIKFARSSHEENSVNAITKYQEISPYVTHLGGKCESKATNLGGKCESKATNLGGKCESKAFEPTNTFRSVQEMDLVQVNELLKSVAEKQNKFSSKLAILSRHFNTNEELCASENEDVIDDQNNDARSDIGNITGDRNSHYSKKESAISNDFTSGAHVIVCESSQFERILNVRTNNDDGRAMSGETVNVRFDSTTEGRNKSPVNVTFQHKVTVEAIMKMTSTSKLHEKTSEKSQQSGDRVRTSVVSCESDADEKKSSKHRLGIHRTAQTLGTFERKEDLKRCTEETSQELYQSQHFGEGGINDGEGKINDGEGKINDAKNDGVTKSVTNRERGKLLTDRESILLIVRGILGTEQEDFVDIVADIVEAQNVIDTLEGSTTLRFDMAKVQIYCRNGVSLKPVLVNGLVIKTTSDVVDSVLQYPGKHYSALLVNADITMSYRHKGYNPLKVKQTMTSQQYMEGCSASETWLESLLCLLKQLNVTLLLVKGRVSPDVQHSCDAASILIISRVPYQLLEQISTSTQVDLLTYVPLATQTHVCSDLTLSTSASHRSGRVQLVGQSQSEVVLCTPDALFQTVVIFGVSPVVCNLRKQKVLNCLHRMTSVLNSSDLLIGEGGFEQTCIKTCERKIDQGERLLSTDDDAGVANVLIARALRDCLLNYINLPACPSSQLESLSGRIDMHHWALNLARIALKTDSVVVTGLNGIEMPNL